MGNNDDKNLLLKDLMDMGNMLLSQSFTLDAYHNILKSTVSKAIEVFNCDRCCIVLKNKRGELVIKAGFPSNCHGIGQKISHEAETFLSQVIRDKRIVFINDPRNDEKVSYMKDMIEFYSITSIIFAPIFYIGSHEDCVGVMVLDKTNGDGEKFYIDYQKIKIVTDTIGWFIKKAYEKMRR